MWRVSHVAHSIGLFCLLFLVTACSKEEETAKSYEQFTARMVMAVTSAPQRVSKCVTDEGDTLLLTKPAEVSWATVADTAWRAMLYYNAIDEHKAQPIALQRVPVLIPSESTDTIGNDPLEVESVWTSGQRRWLNLRLRVMTATPDQTTAKQLLGATLRWEGTMPLLTLHHRQNGVPQYFSQSVFLSIPLQGVSSTPLMLRVLTAQGWFTGVY